MVKYRFRKLTCSIDGTDQKTYSIYRVNGNLGKVLDNIQMINHLKRQYNSFYPVLNWLFVVFGHNEHQIPEARKTARELNMSFSAKLSWDDLYTETFSPVKDTALVAVESGLGAGSRKEYREKYGKEYMSKVCHSLWVKPQVNHDGRLLGCTVNYWGDYGNVFDDGLINCINNEKIS
jgi:MoaA/NifB/PqqE/SkfB family radical SAM enzyme